MRRLTKYSPGIGIILVAVLGVYLQYRSHPSITSSITSTTSFHYGFDFTDQEPDPKGQDIQAANNDPNAVIAAKKVLSTFAGSYMDQSIYGFGGQHNPEPSLGNYDFSSITPRINMITTAGGTPVITLVQAPGWMNDGTGDPNNLSAFSQPPSPSHYQDFARLCARIADAYYPQVKYFTVWSEMRGFYNQNTHSIDAANYTTMYLDVYNAIKAAHPDDMVGGPYATMSSYSTPQSGNTNSTLHGSWGYIDAQAQTALSYWLANMHGKADYLAIDGATEIAKQGNTTGLPDAVTASQKYAAVDNWIKAQTNLPIWWMESHIAPMSGWTDAQGAAARIATLILMSSSGTSVGMQWQPQDQSSGVGGVQAWPDEGLWTSVLSAGGGQPTTLGKILPSVLSVISQPITLVSGQPVGVLVATGSGSAVLVNTNNTASTATLNGTSITLGAGAVEVKSLSSPQPTPTPTSTPNPTPTPTGTAGAGGSTIAGSPTTTASTTPVQLGSGNAVFYPALPPSSSVTVVKAQYYLGSTLLATVTTSPYSYTLKASTIINGAYAFKTITYYSDGTTQTTVRQVTIKNPENLQQLTLVAQHYAWAGIPILLALAVGIYWLAAGNPFIKVYRGVTTKKSATESKSTTSDIEQNTSVTHGEPGSVVMPGPREE
jgi:hypothetical protein